MKKRLFSLILAFALLLSAVPTVFAATHHEVVIDGVVYWVYPEEGYAEIHSTVRGSLPQVLEIPQYVNGYPVTRLDTFGLTDLEGVVGVILPDTMTFIDDISIAGFDLVFVSLPNNEVNIEKNFVGGPCPRLLLSAPKLLSFAGVQRLWLQAVCQSHLCRL